MAELSRGIRSSMKIEGLDALRRALRQLPDAVQKKVLAGAVAKGAKVIADDARSRAPVLKTPDARRTPGLLRRMIRATRGKRNGSEAASFVSVRRLVGKALGKMKIKKGQTGAQLDPFYWAFQEFGSSGRPAQPFLRPAFDAKKEAAALEIKTALAEGIAREAAKAGGDKLF